VARALKYTRQERQQLSKKAERWWNVFSEEGSDMQNTIASAQELIQRVQELEIEVAKWRSIAERDGLTGCLRREAFMTLLEQRRKFGLLPKTMSVAIVDVDHFKRVNDTHGHLAGDKVLEQLGQILSQHAPEGSLVCRMGGEEFVILIPDEATLAMGAAEKLRTQIAKTSIRTGISQNLSITASIGVAQWDTDRPLIEATARADEALYRAKHSGRNRVAA
jgi:diguanylate cyclase (GGDEF)-like protein